MGDIHGVGRPARWALTLRALKTSVVLSLLFVLVYGSTNWFTAQRPDADVRTWYFAWERTVLPYLPLLIVPYMSIDLFFFMATFLCRDEREMRVLAQRVVFSILVAATSFLVLPLKLAWPARPRVDGWFGDFVEQSCSAPFLMEYPHNLFPAMHVALCLILADVYARHTRGVVRGLLYIWFGLIILSTVLTWQHHLVDVAGGVVVAGFAFSLFRESGTRLPVPSLPDTGESWARRVLNVRVGCYYAAGAALVLSAAPAVWPWGAFLLWPAAALGMVAAGYFGLGPDVFNKTEGRLPLSTRFVLAPILFGQYLSLAYYRRQCRAWDEAVPGVRPLRGSVLIGRILTKAEASAALEQGVTAVLDLTAEFSEAAPFLATRYRNLPILDLTAPTQDQLHEAVAFIAEEANQGTVYVHCKIGYSRSAAVVGAYLLASHEAATAEEAVDRLRTVRPSIVVRAEAMEALRAFERRDKEIAFVEGPSPITS
jgi:protein-tyrosine phosphatase